MKKIIKTNVIGIMLIIIICMLTKIKLSAVELANIELTNVNNNIVKLNLKDNSEVEIKSLDNNYQITNCETYSDLFDASYENNTCIIKAKNFGVSQARLYFENDLEETITKQILIDIDIDNYIKSIFEEIPNEISLYEEEGYYDYLQENYGSNNININCFDCETFGFNSKCNVVVNYYYMDLNGETINKKLSKYVIFKRAIPAIGDLTLNVGNSKQLYYDINSEMNIKPEDLVFISLNNNIASVSQEGTVTGNMKGETEIRLYDLNTMRYTTANIKVKEITLNSIDELRNHFNGTNIIIDASTIEGLRYCDTSNTENCYISALSTYFSNYVQGLPSNYSVYMNWNTTSCNGNTCRIGYTVYDGMSNKDEITNDFTVTLKGINAVKEDNLFGETSINFLNYIRLFGLTDVTINVDPEYFRYNENTGQYETIKSGETLVEFIKDGYYASTKYTIDIDKLAKEEQIREIINNLENINLQYKSTDFTNKQYLEGIVKSIVLSNIDNNLISPKEIQVKCNFKYTCNVTLNKPNYYINPKNIKITYNELSTNNLINELIELDSKINNVYNLTFEETITLLNNYSKEDFYNHLIDKTNIISVDKGNFEIILEQIEHNDINNLLYGNISYYIIYKNNNEEIYRKEIIINSTPVVYIENSNEEKIISLIKSILGESTLVTSLEYNYYKVNNKFNILVSNKEINNPSSINLKDNTITLNIGDTYKIEYRLYPTNSSPSKITYLSKNEDVCVVDSDGNVTGISKGIAIINVKVGNSVASLKVFVNTSPEEILNDILNRMNNHVIINYSNNNTDLKNLISNGATSEINKYDTYKIWPSSEVKEENGKYFLRLTLYSNGYSRYFSNWKEVTYEYKGISVNATNVSMRTGETYNTELFFTEGSNENLVFDISDKSVITFDASGKITALKTGQSYIYIYDKYNKYYNNINVMVDEDEYYTSLINKVKEKGVIIDGESYNSINYHSSNKIEDVFRNKLDREISIYRFANSSNTNCNLNKMECTIYLKRIDNQGNELKSWTETLKISYSGIFLDKREVKLQSNQDYTPTFTKYSEGEVTLESKDTSICTVSNGVIHTLKEGICPVKFTVGNEITYQFIIVNEDKITSDIQNQLDNIEIPLIIKNDPYTEDATNDQELYVKQDLYWFQIGNIIKDQINTPYEIAVNIDYESLAKEKMNINLNLHYSYQDRENEIYYNYNLNSSNLVEREFNLNYTGIPEEYKELGNVVKQNIKTEYNLTLNQILKYQMDLKNGKVEVIDKYSSISDDIKQVCPECTYKFDIRGGGEEENAIFMGGYVIVYKDDYPIYYGNIEFSARFDVEIDNIQDDEKFIETIKEEVKSAYLEMKSSQTRKLRKTLLSNPEDIEVSVTREIEAGNIFYNISVEELSFKAQVGTVITEEISYIPNLEITLKNDSPYVQLGKTIKLGYTKNKETEVTENWRSLNDSIVTVDQTGNITGVSLGETQVILTIEGKEYTYNVRVGERVLGDINNDGTVDNKDVFLAIKVVLKIVPMEDNYLLGGDTNLDNKITNTDIMYMIKKILKIVE